MIRTLAVLAVAALLAGCSAGDDPVERADVVTTTTAAGTAAPPTDPVVPPIEWTSCGSAECATVPAPVDHDEPDGPTIELSVLRLPARGDRIGALFVNFGGPGSSTVELVPTFPFPAEVRDRFDIVAVDPRGVGGSAPLECGVDPRVLYAVDHTVEDAGDTQALIEVSEDYAADCAAEAADLLPHVGTRDVARDLDRVRARMGDERLDFLGYSYGTSIGQAYADLFPARVRTMILDGLVDPAPTGVEVATQQAAGFEVALGRWADGCRDRPSCPFDDPVGAVDRMLAAAESTVPSSTGRALGPGEAAIGLAMPLYSSGLWPALDQAVARTLDGDGAGMVALADQYAELVEFPAYFAVSCLDSNWPRDPEEHLAAAEAAAVVAPRFGEAIVNDYLRCPVWPVPSDPLEPTTAEGAPPVLVVSTTGDPATPHENGIAVAERLASGVLLTHEGDGHTIVFQGNRCVDDAALAYLLDQEVPEEGTRC